MKIKNDLQTDTVRANPRRVYKCKAHGGFLLRENVWKDRETGIYYCKLDNSIVEDVTDRETGQNLMEIINL